MADRRKSTDRRTPSDRRRSARRNKNDDRRVVLELTSDELRFAELRRGAAETDADEVVAASAIWRREAPSLLTDEGVAELSAAMRDMVREQTLQGAAVRLVLAGDYCIVRTARGAADEVRAELAQLEQRSRMYLALGPGEKVLVSRVRALDARHSSAMAAACNRATLDAIQAASEAANVEITVIEPALVALSRAVGRLPDAPQEPCIVVHVDHDSIDVGVCHEGRLLLDYRPGGRTKAADLPTLIDSHLNRLSRHVSRFMRGDAATIKQVFLCGDRATVDEAARHFRGQSKIAVRAVRPQEIQATWKLGEGTDRAASTTGLGGLLAWYMADDEFDAPNLMEHILDRKRAPLRPVLLRSLAPLAAVLLVALGLRMLNFRQEQILTEMQSELDGLAAAQTRATELRLTLSASDAKLEQLSKLAEQLPPELGDEIVRRVGACMPGDVWLSKMELADGKTVQIEGASYLEAGVYDFVRWLEQAPGIAEVALKRTNAAMASTGPTTSFGLEINLENFAKSVAKVARHE